jgi:hypothetical protein
MKISSTRTGGIAAPATDKSWGPVETTELGDNGIKMEGLVESVGFFDLADSTVGDDEFVITIEVVDGDRNHKVSYSEPGRDVPADLEKLQKLIEEVAPSS